MSLQVFLQARLLGAQAFLARPPAFSEDPAASFIGRCTWLNLYCEVLPRALLAELSLSRMLLGSATAEQFLLVLAEEDISRANEFLSRAATEVSVLSASTLRLVWASTEDLGAWPIARKRLDDALASSITTELAHASDPAAFLEPTAESDHTASETFFQEFGSGLVPAQSVGWSPEHPAHLAWNAGRYTWPLVEQTATEADSIAFSRRIAQNDSGQSATIQDLASRAAGAHRWGILLADVDHFDAQLRRQGSVEEHIHLSILFKEFFAGELSVLCTMPEFWRKVTVLYRGGNSFAVAGSWDGLLNLAREIQRLFARFAEESLATAATQDGKTISMALAIAEEDETMSSVFAKAGAAVREAKAAGVDNFHLFGRILEWKRLTDAEELKTNLLRLVSRHGYSPDYIHDLASVYRESSSTGRSTLARRKTSRLDKPWRTYMRLAQVIPQERGKDLNALRTTVINNLIGKRTAALKLRPSGRVGLEWARLAAAKETLE